MRRGLADFGACALAPKPVPSSDNMIRTSRRVITKMLRERLWGTWMIPDYDRLRD